MIRKFMATAGVAACVLAGMATAALPASASSAFIRAPSFPYSSHIYSENPGSGAVAVTENGSSTASETPVTEAPYTGSSDFQAEDMGTLNGYKVYSFEYAGKFLTTWRNEIPTGGGRARLYPATPSVPNDTDTSALWEAVPVNSQHYYNKAHQFYGDKNDVQLVNVANTNLKLTFNGEGNALRLYSRDSGTDQVWNLNGSNSVFPFPGKPGPKPGHHHSNPAVSVVKTGTVIGGTVLPGKYHYGPAVAPEDNTAIDYTVAVTNTGNVPLNNVVVSDVVTVNGTPGSSADLVCVTNCSPSVLGAGQTRTFTDPAYALTAANNGLTDSVVNTATVSASAADSAHTPVTGQSSVTETYSAL